jgi:hypothetical protein
MIIHTRVATVILIVAAAAAPGQAQRACTDADGDGYCSIATGGTDCDDGNGRRHPGNAEVCDAMMQDEDCNPYTIGYRDVDGDGHNDHLCCNRFGSSWRCGNDCDDHVRTVIPGTMRCVDDGGTAEVLICAGGRGPFLSPWDAEVCRADSVCLPQPNHTAICR